MIDALNDERLISLLAEPNLTAMTGETASFLAGGEFPILVPQGDDQVTIDFKKFGVSLAFTPTIIGGSKINLHVRPEVSKNTGRIVGGEIQFQARDSTRLPQQEMRRIRGNEISMIFQEPMTSLDPGITIGDQIAEIRASASGGEPRRGPQSRDRYAAPGWDRDRRSASANIRTNFPAACGSA